MTADPTSTTPTDTTPTTSATDPTLRAAASTAPAVPSAPQDATPTTPTNPPLLAMAVSAATAIADAPLTPPAAEPVETVPATIHESIAQRVDEWFAQHFHNLAGTVDTFWYNHVHAAKEALKQDLAELVAHFR